MQSEDVTELSVQWRLEARGHSTRLVFRIRSVAQMAVPQMVQRSLLRRSALRTVERLEQLMVEGQAPGTGTPAAPPQAYRTRIILAT